MRKTALLAAAAVLAITAGHALAAGKPVPSMKGTQFNATRLTVPGNLKTLYNQNYNYDNAAVGSQMFESSYAQYDDQAADDFVVPTGKVWEVKEVDVTGHYDGLSGPAASENVYFYENNGTLPGKQISQALGVKGADNGGSFAIRLPAAVKLTAAHYWVSVQAVCDFRTCGQWFWQAEQLPKKNPPVWQNPSGGYGLNCPTWNTVQNCALYAPALMFALKGRSE